MTNSHPQKRIPVCDYEGSDYQARFWDQGTRSYEDGCEAHALTRLLPKQGNLLLELGAGAGRNSTRYSGYKQVVLLDYSLSQLELAQKKLGKDSRYIFVVADIYHLPFIKSIFDTATMIRVLHHMADAPFALQRVRDCLQPGAAFILEYANKRNLKAIARYAFRKQSWNPFSKEPYEFTPLNFDFHPAHIQSMLREVGFLVKRILTVSHLRINFLKKSLPTRLLVWLDSLLQPTGSILQLTPSVFVLARIPGQLSNHTNELRNPCDLFKCPKCDHHPLELKSGQLACPSCQKTWQVKNGIYIFKELTGGAL